MSLNARKVKGTSVKHPNMEAGTYPGRLVQLIDLGVQKQRPFKGVEKDPHQSMMLTYEFVDEFLLDEDGKEMKDKPRWLSEDFPLYSLEADRAKSTQRYYAMDPDEDNKGEWPELISAPCMITVVENEGKGKNKGNTYNNIASVSSMRAKEASKLADLVNPPKVFVLDEPDMKVFFSLPNWIQDKIKENLEFEGSLLDEAIQNYDGDNAEEAPDESDVETTPEEEEDW